MGVRVFFVLFQLSHEAVVKQIVNNEVSICFDLTGCNHSVKNDFAVYDFNVSEVGHTLQMCASGGFL
jgi:hypothetical protein